MQIPAERWLEAIYKRHSRRQYDSKQLPQEIITSLTSFLAELNQHLTGARVVFINENPEEVFKGIVGSYGKIQGAPAYAAFLGDMSDPNVQEKVGYLGECFVLEATALGLGTCWVGGFFRPQIVARQTEIRTGEHVLSVTPVGLIRENYSWMEKTMSSFAGSKNRKKLKELCIGQVGSNLPKWVKAALEAARVAPSAVNRQPWRFELGDKGIKVKVDSEKNITKISKRLDCGIAMLHLEVGALANGVKGEWEYLESPDVARFIQTS